MYNETSIIRIQLLPHSHIYMLTDCYVSTAIKTGAKKHEENENEWTDYRGPAEQSLNPN